MPSTYLCKLKHPSLDILPLACIEFHLKIAALSQFALGVYSCF